MHDFIPVLSDGNHKRPEDGACIMEMVSFMSGDEWTDTPECTLPAIAGFAQVVNDYLPDEHRHLILSQFDRLFNTNNIEEDDLNKALLGFAFEAVRNYTFYVPHREGYALEYLSNGRPLDALEWIVIDSRKTREAQLAVDMLAGVLDAYDKVAGRETVLKQDLTKLQALPCQV